MIDLKGDYNGSAETQLVLVDYNSTFAGGVKGAMVDLMDALIKAGEYKVVIYSDAPENCDLSFTAMCRHGKDQAGFYGEVVDQSTLQGTKAFAVFDSNAAHGVDAVATIDPVNENAVKKVGFWLSVDIDAIDAAIQDARAPKSGGPALDKPF